MSRKHMQREAVCDTAAGSTSVSAGKRTRTEGASMIQRAADVDLAAALGPRDDNGVSARAEDAVERAGGSSGAPLPGGLRDRFEGSLGADLSGVRVHTGDASAAASEAVGARAYTVGQDIHFGAGQFQADDPFGMHLIAHEVAHTVQQGGGPAHRQHKLAVSSPADAAEVEADRAADAMVAGATFTIGSDSAPSVQRVLNDNDTGVWNAGKGDAHVAALKALVPAWSKFREQPVSRAAMKAIGGGDAARGLADLVRGAKNFAAHAVAELGPETVVALDEMCGFMVPGFAQLGGVLPGVSNKAPGHFYTLSETDAFTNSLPMTPLKKFEATYKNRYGWSWTRTVGNFGFSIGVSGKGLGGGSIDLQAKLESESPLYFGYDDFGGELVVVSGGGVTTTIGALKGGVSGGGIAKLHSAAGTLDFIIKAELKGLEPGLNDPREPIEVSFGSVGGGKLFKGGQTDISTPTITKKPKAVERNFGPYTVLGFPTGEAETDPGQVSAAMDRVRRDTASLTEMMERERGDRERLGLDREVRLQIIFEGYASRIWEAAKDESERQARNLELSRQRAEHVKARFDGLGPHELQAHGYGAAVRGAGGAPVAVTDKPGVAAAERLGGPRSQADHDTYFGDRSNDDQVRQVRILVRWRGHTLTGGYGPDKKTTLDATTAEPWQGGPDAGESGNGPGTDPSTNNEGGASSVSPSDPPG